MKITPYIHYDLYSNGNFVKSFNSKEDVDKYFHDMFEEEKIKWFVFDNFETSFIQELNDKNYSIIKSEYLHFS